jgi:hypothetical protein
MQRYRYPCVLPTLKRNIERVPQRGQISYLPGVGIYLFLS